MDVKRQAARKGRRVTLTRSGSGAGKNVRRTPKREHDFSLPMQGVKRFFTTTFFLCGIITIVAAVSVGLFYAYNHMVSGEYFALKTVEIHGNVRLNSREILETVDLTSGGNTLALSIDAVEESLARHPWVEEISVKRVLPGTLIISLREKTPAFWRLHNGALFYADTCGKLIAPVAAGQFASLPTLEIEPGAEDSANALPDLVRSLKESRLPINFSSVSTVRLSAARGVEVQTGDARLKISIGLEDWLENLTRLGLTLGDLARRGEMPGVREIKAQGANVWVERREAFNGDVT